MLDADFRVRLQGSPVIAILRGLPAQHLLPTVEALALGCAAVKVFPANVGGPAYFRALQGPYPGVPLVAVGGVTPDNLGEYLQAGALAVGLGSELVRAGDAAPDYAAITARARRCMAPLS